MRCIAITGGKLRRRGWKGREGLQEAEIGIKGWVILNKF